MSATHISESQTVPLHDLLVPSISGASNLMCEIHQLAEVPCGFSLSLTA